MLCSDMQLHEYQKCIPDANIYRNYKERVTPLIMEKLRNHSKQFCSHDKRNEELSFTSFKQEVEYFMCDNNKLSPDLLKKRKDIVYKI